MPSTADLLRDAMAYQRGGALDKALERYDDAVNRATDPAILSEALRRRASVHRTRCHWDHALDDARRSAETARRAGLITAYAEALNAEAAVHLARGDFDSAVPMLENVLTATDDPRIRGNAHQNLGSIAATRGDHEAAERHFQQSYHAFLEAGHAGGVAVALNNFGNAALLRGDVVRAESVLSEAIDAARTLGDLDLLHLANLNYATALARTGDLERAEMVASSSLGYYSLSGNQWRRIECLRLMGEIAELGGDRETARRCYEQALTVAREIEAKVEAAQLETLLAAV